MIYSKTITQIKFIGEILYLKKIIKKEKTSNAQKSECLCLCKAHYKSDQQNKLTKYGIILGIWHWVILLALNI